MIDQEKNNANFDTLGINSVENIVKITVSRMDSIINTMLISSIADTEVVSKLNIVNTNLKSSTKQIVGIIKNIGSSIKDINIELAKLNEKNIVSIIDAGKFSLSTSLTMLIRNGKNQYKGVMGIFLAYSSMIEMVSRLSEFSKGIKPRKINRVINYIPSLIKLMISSLIDLNKILINQSLETTKINFGVLNIIINQIISILTSIYKLTELSSKIDIKLTKKTIRSIPRLMRVMLRTIDRVSKYSDKAVSASSNSKILFDTFNEIIIRMQQSMVLMVDLVNIQNSGGAGKNVKKAVRSAILTTFGLIWFTIKRTIAISLLAIKFYPFILISSIMMPFYFGVFNKIFTLLSPILNQLIKLGQHAGDSVKGMWVLYAVLVGTKVNPGLVTIFEDEKIQKMISNSKQLWGLIKFMGMITIVMGMLFLIQNILAFIGDRYIDIWKGLLVTRMIFGGSKYLPGKLAVESLFDIVFNADLIKKRRLAASLIPVMKDFTIIMSMIMIMGIELMVIGRYHIRIWLGSHAVKRIIKSIEYIVDLNERIKKDSINDARKNCIEFLFIISSFVLIAIEFALIGVMALGVALSIPVILLMVVGIFVIMKLLDWISKFIKITNLTKSITSIMLASLALSLITAALVLVSKNIDQINYKAILMLILCSVTLLGFFALLGLASPMLGLALMGIGAFVLLTAALNLLTFNLLLLSSINIESLERAKINAKMVIDTSIYIIRHLYRARRKARIRKGRAFETFLFLAFTLLSVTAILLTVTVLLMLNKIEMSDLQNAEDNADKVMNIALRIIQMSRRRAPEGEKNKSLGLGKILGWFFPGIMNVIGIIISFFLIATTVVTVGLILLTAHLIISLNNIELGELQNAETNVDRVFDIAFRIIHKAIHGGSNNTDDKKDKGNKRKGLGGLIGKLIPSLMNVIDAIISFGFVAVTLASISLIYFIAKELTYLQKLDLNQATIEKNVNGIFDVSKIIVNIANSDENKINNAKDTIKNADNVLDLLRRIKSSSKIISEIGEMNNQGQFDKAIDSYIKFVDKINTVKVENLQTATNMFEKMAEFSKSISGNFEGLADVINEKIMPLLEELNGSLNKTNDSIGGMSSRSSSTTQSFAPVMNASGGASQSVPQKDYTDSIDQLRQEIKRLQDILTDGSQRTMVDSR